MLAGLEGTDKLSPTKVDAVELLAVPFPLVRGAWNMLFKSWNRSDFLIELSSRAVASRVRLMPTAGAMIAASASVEPDTGMALRPMAASNR
jgi:hypothetical protein